MALLQWALTCKNVSVDKATNNVTYRDAIEQLRTDEFPAQIPPLIIVAMLWRREDIDAPESFEYRVRLEDDEREVVDRTEPETVDLGDYERFRSGLHNPPFEIEEPGTIWFVIEKNEGEGWEDVGELPVEIKRIDEGEIDIELVPVEQLDSD